MSDPDHPRVLPGLSGQQEKTLRGILIAGATLIAAIIALSLLLGVDAEATLWTYGVGLALHLGHLAWLRHATVRRVAVSHCITYFIWVTLILVLRYGGLRAPAAFVYPPLILVAGLVWSGRAALGMALVSSAAGALLVVGEKWGWLTTAEQFVPPARLWMVMTACVVITAVVLLYALDIIQRSVDATLQSDRRYAELVESAPDAMLFCDGEGEVRACNQAACNLWACERSRLIGTRLSELLDDPNDARSVLTSPTGEGVASIEMSIKTCANQSVPVELRTRGVSPGEAASGVHLTVRDVRERRAAVEARERLEAQLRQAQRLEALGRLAGGVAHDFNNLLTIILGNLTFLRPARDERAGKAVEAIEEATGRASDLTRQLLALGRRQVFESAVVDLNAVVTSLESMLRRLLPEDVSFHIKLTGNSCWVAADATQLSQVLLNLVGNARDAARPGGTIAIGTAVEGNSVVMTVEDDGIGMSADTQAHMFEPFFTTKESTGTGLGLATVHGIVSQLGGQISVTSAEGKGSGFTVHLPRASAPQGQARLEEPSVAPQGAARILVIEDDAAVRAVVCSMLQSAGYTVSAADTADGAQRQAASGEKIDLVISDVVLSDASGPVVVSGLKRRSPQLKVLFVSGHAEGLIAQRGMLSPGTHFLAKPFTRDVLLAKVDQILKGSSTHHEIPQPLAAS